MESKAAGSLQHNNTARIHALEDDGDTHFIVSDRADTRLMKHKPLYCHGEINMFYFDSYQAINQGYARRDPA